VRVNPAGIAFDLAGYVGGTGTDDAGGIAVDGLGGVYLAGTAGSGPGSFPTGTGIGGITSFDPTENRGGEEGFLVKVATAADLSLAAAVAAPSVAVGGQVPVALTVSNAGPASVGAAVVSVPVPAGVAVAGASASQGSCSVAQAVTCALGALAAGGKATVSLTLVPSLEGPLAANASAASEFEDLAPLNNVAAVQASARVPGGLVLGKAKVKATWAVSRLSGSVTLAGSVREAVTLTVTLAKQARSSTGVGAVRAVAGAAKPCRLAIGKACSVALGAGTFSKTLALARTVPPGTYQLRVTGKAADGLAVPAQTLTVKVPKPPEGVVDRVWVSVQKKSSPRSGVPRTADQFFVHFRFAALPKRRQLVLVIRYPGGERRVVDDYLAARLVEPRQPGPLLPGRWTFTLRSGARTIARAIVNVT
jgi:hypothetical protein